MKISFNIHYRLLLIHNLYAITTSRRYTSPIIITSSGETGRGPVIYLQTNKNYPTAYNNNNYYYLLPAERAVLVLYLPPHNKHNSTGSVHR